MDYQSIPSHKDSDDSGRAVMLEEQHALIHGVLATVSVAFLFTMGMLVMKARAKISLRLHILLQFSGAVGCLLGVGFVVAKLEGPIPLTEPHVLIGLFVLGAVLLQLLLGWMHHRGFLKGIPTPTTTVAYTCIGRTIISAGCVNAAMSSHAVCVSDFRHLFRFSGNHMGHSFGVSVTFVPSSDGGTEGGKGVSRRSTFTTR
ncbi:hypothetical protein CC79DRAFT_1322148 [Sarocladium strictum]